MFWANCNVTIEDLPSEASKFLKNLSHDAAFFKYPRESSTRKVYFAERNEGAFFENFQHKSAIFEHLRAETIDKVYFAEGVLENFKWNLHLLSIWKQELTRTCILPSVARRFLDNLNRNLHFFEHVGAKTTEKVYFAERSEAVFGNFKPRSALFRASDAFENLFFTDQPKWLVHRFPRIATEIWDFSAFESMKHSKSMLPKFCEALLKQFSRNLDSFEHLREQCTEDHSFTSEARRFYKIEDEISSHSSIWM